MAGRAQAAAEQRIRGAQDPIVPDRPQRQLRVPGHLHPVLRGHHHGRTCQRLTVRSQHNRYVMVTAIAQL